jgi:simple sugar transport system ATP-binding protein
VSTLSGGNQQKVVVARELSRPLRVFIAAQPTRGVDVGSIEFIHGRIVHERDVGTAVLVISSELDEVVGLADRIAVMYRGRILAIVSPDTPREALGLLMAGITEPGARGPGAPDIPVPAAPVPDAQPGPAAAAAPVPDAQPGPAAAPGPGAGTRKPDAPEPTDDADGDGVTEKGTK